MSKPVFNWQFLLGFCEQWTLNMQVRDQLIRIILQLSFHISIAFYFCLELHFKCITVKKNIPWIPSQIFYWRTHLNDEKNCDNFLVCELYNFVLIFSVNSHTYLTVAVHAMHLCFYIFRNTKLRSDSIKVLLQWRFFVKITSQKPRKIKWKCDIFREINFLSYENVRILYKKD